MRSASELIGSDQLATAAAPPPPPPSPTVTSTTTTTTANADTPKETYVFTLRDGLFSLTRRTAGKRGAAVLCKTALTCSAGCRRDMAQERRVVDHPRLCKLFGVRVPCCLSCEESLQYLSLGDTATDNEQCAVCLSTDACKTLRRDDTAAEIHVCELCANADWVAAIESTGASLRDTPAINHPANGLHVVSPKPRKRQRPEAGVARKRKAVAESCGHEPSAVSCGDCGARLCNDCLRQREPGMAPLYLSTGSWRCAEHSKQ